jgi:hypothetical protein
VQEGLETVKSVFPLSIVKLVTGQLEFELVKVPVKE